MDRQCILSLNALQTINMVCCSMSFVRCTSLSSSVRFSISDNIHHLLSSLVTMFGACDSTCKTCNEKQMVPLSLFKCFANEQCTHNSTHAQRTCTRTRSRNYTPAQPHALILVLYCIAQHTCLCNVAQSYLLKL